MSIGKADKAFQTQLEIVIDEWPEDALDVGPLILTDDPSRTEYLALAGKCERIPLIIGIALGNALEELDSKDRKELCLDVLDIRVSDQDNGFGIYYWPNLLYSGD